MLSFFVLTRCNIPKAYFDVVLSPRIPSFSSVSVGWLLCIGYEQKISLVWEAYITPDKVLVPEVFSCS